MLVRPSSRFRRLDFLGKRSRIAQYTFLFLVALGICMLKIHGLAHDACEFLTTDSDRFRSRYRTLELSRPLFATVCSACACFGQRSDTEAGPTVVDLWRAASGAKLRRRRLTFWRIACDPRWTGDGEALVCHPRVGMISFTRSRVACRSIGQVCGQMQKKVALKREGNSANVILDDADIDATGSNGAWCSFLYQQLTVRHLAHRSLANEYSTPRAFTRYSSRWSYAARICRVSNPSLRVRKPSSFLEEEILLGPAILVGCSR